MGQVTPEEAAAKLSPANFGKSKIGLLERLVFLGEGGIKRRTPVRRGALRRSITGKVTSPGVQGVVGTNLGYARLVHDGTKPHTISPRTKKALYWSGAAHPVRSVRHPGTAAQPFLTDGLNDARPDMDKAAAAMGEAFFASVS